MAPHSPGGGKQSAPVLSVRTLPLPNPTAWYLSPEHPRLATVFEFLVPSVSSLFVPLGVDAEAEDFFSTCRASTVVQIFKHRGQRFVNGVVED